jgi:ribonuclease HI
VAEHSGHEAKTTNNRMEMTAALEALRTLSPGEAATIHTDSQLLVNGATQWLAGWKRKGWKKADGQPVLNADLWQAIDAEMQRVEAARWNWVRGHAGNRWNERADQLAVQAAASGKGARRVLGPDAAPRRDAPAAAVAPREPASAARAAEALLALRAATARRPDAPDGGAFADELVALRELERFVRSASADSRVPEPPGRAAGPRGRRAPRTRVLTPSARRPPPRGGRPPRLRRSPSPRGSARPAWPRTSLRRPRAPGAPASWAPRRRLAPRPRRSSR